MKTVFSIFALAGIMGAIGGALAFIMGVVVGVFWELFTMECTLTITASMGLFGFLYGGASGIAEACKYGGQ